MLTSEIASFVLRTAWFRLRMSARNFAATAIPAASSEAELMRLPEDNRSIAFSKPARLPAKIRAAEIDGMFVLTTIPTDINIYPNLWCKKLTMAVIASFI